MEAEKTEDTETETCIINSSPTACQLPNIVAIIAFLASIGFLVGEFFFDQMSSVKSRKHFVVADLAFSGKLCSINYFVKRQSCFLVLPPMNFRQNVLLATLDMNSL